MVSSVLDVSRMFQQVLVSSRSVVGVGRVVNTSRSSWVQSLMVVESGTNKIKNKK